MENVNQTIIEHTNRIAKAEASTDSAHHRLNTHEKRITKTEDICNSIHTISLEMKNLREDFNSSANKTLEIIDKLSDRVKTLEERNVKKWSSIGNSIITSAIWFFIVILLAYIANKLGWM